MRSSVRFTVLSCALAFTSAMPAAAQSGSVTADLLSDVSEVEKKFMALAKAIPHATLWIVPDASHSVLQEKPEVANPRVLAFLLSGSASSNPVLLILQLLLVLAWKVAGWIGLDQWLLPLLGTPWYAGNIFRRGEAEPPGGPSPGTASPR